MPIPNNPLKSLWGFVTTVLGVIGISSLIQNALNDLFALKGFIATIIESYRAVMNPVFEILFAWLPFNVPRWLNDYIFFGLIFSGSALRAFSSASDEYAHQNISSKLIIFLVTAPVWPIGILLTARTSFGFGKSRDRASARLTLN